MALISLQDISLGFGGLPVLGDISLRIEPGERVCLLGRNGEGKSSLLKLIAGLLQPDSGTILRQQELRIGYLGQDVPQNLTGTVFDIVASGLAEQMELLARHHTVSQRLTRNTDETLLAELESIQHKLDTMDGWNARQRTHTVLSRLQLDGAESFDTLSGGMKRRALLARALVNSPGLLLLDEPTNHLDINAITWLEDFLLGAGLSLLFVTHDRALLRKLATRILDLDRGGITSWPGNYDTYLKRKEETLTVEANQQLRFDRKLAQEEIWIRQGIKARRTRNEGRVRALLELRRERQARRELTGRVRMTLQEAEKSGRLVAEAKNVTLRHGGKNIVRDFSHTVMRGDKIGIIGPNGAGKTTLLQFLLGNLQPSEGSLRHGTNLHPAYFDQHRALLDEEKTVMANIADGNDTVDIDGRRKHVMGYLQDFLFTPDRARSPVKILSGGERNRLLLAKLFARPSNVLVLDEPTNDLDIETLELLEELLFDYKGTVFLVSHDRDFLNNVVTSTLVFEGNGQVREYAGGYDDWLLQRPMETAARQDARTEKKERKKTPDPGPRKLTFKETHELEALPAQIEKMEAEQRELYDAMASPSFYQTGGDGAVRARERLAELEQALGAAYERWQELESLREKYSDWKDKAAKATASQE